MNRGLGQLLRRRPITLIQLVVVVVVGHQVVIPQRMMISVLACATHVMRLLLITELILVKALMTRSHMLHVTDVLLTS